MAELKPCPFCRHPSCRLIGGPGSRGGPKYWAGCDMCHGRAWGDTAEEAIVAWNTRADSQLVEQRDALAEAGARLLKACYVADAREELPLNIDGTLLDAMSEAIWPDIWTDEQVEALNAYQSGYGHPFTCGSGNRMDEAHKAVREEDGGDYGQLIATRQGWICPACDYRQFWAHEHMFAGAMPDPLAAIEPKP